MKTRTREAMQMDTMHVLDALIEKVEQMEQQMQILTELYLLLKPEPEPDYDYQHDYQWERDNDTK